MEVCRKRASYANVDALESGYAIVESGSLASRPNDEMMKTRTLTNQRVRHPKNQPRRLAHPPDLRATPLIAYNEVDLNDAEMNRLIQKAIWTVSNHTGKPWILDVYILSPPI